MMAGGWRLRGGGQLAPESGGIGLFGGSSANAAKCRNAIS